MNHSQRQVTRSMSGNAEADDADDRDAEVEDEAGVGVRQKLGQHWDLLLDVTEDMHYAHGIPCNRAATRKLLYSSGREILEVSICPCLHRSVVGATPPLDVCRGRGPGWRGSGERGAGTFQIKMACLPNNGPLRPSQGHQTCRHVMSAC